MRGGKRSTSIKPGEVCNPLGKNQYAPGAAATAKKSSPMSKELAKELTPKANVLQTARAEHAPSMRAFSPPLTSVTAADEGATKLMH